MASIVDEIKGSLAGYNGSWSEKKGLWSFSAVIAERKGFLSKKKLTYSLRLRVDDAARTVRFSELLAETGSGLTSGDDGDGISPGFGMKTESYNTFKSPPQRSIEEQSRQFSKDYHYQIDLGAIHGAVQQLAEKAGYRFEYQLLPVK